MVEIKVREGEDIESMLRRFKKKCELEGQLLDMRRKEFYEKPSAIRRREKKKAIQKAHQKARRDDR